MLPGGRARAKAQENKEEELEVGGSCVAFDEARRGGIYTQGCRDVVCVSLGNGLTLLNVNPTLLLSRCRVLVLCPLPLPRDAVYFLPTPRSPILLPPVSSRRPLHIRRSLPQIATGSTPFPSQVVLPPDLSSCGLDSSIAPQGLDLVSF